MSAEITDDDPNLVSLDIETTGLTRDARITEVAAVHAATGLSAQMWLTVPSDWCWAQWSAENIRPNWEHRDRLPPAKVDERLSVIFEAWGLTYGEVILCGFNVASFDRQYLNDQLERVAAWCGYRHLDLTGIRILLDRVAPVDDGWAGHYKRVAAEALGEHNEHDALWDAKAGLVLWRHAVELLGEVDGG